jgi:hypothetical protein
MHQSDEASQSGTIVGKGVGNRMSIDAEELKAGLDTSGSLSSTFPLSEPSPSGPRDA